MRRTLAFIGAAVVAFGALVGCTGDSTSGSSDTPTGAASEITIWVDATRLTALTDAAAQFEAETGVHVNLEEQNFSDLRNDFAVQVQNNAGPDITVGANDWLGELKEKGVIAPVDLSSIASQLSPNAVQAYTSEGQTYGVPYALENIALIRNNALISETNATTFDELIAEGRAVGVQYAVLVQMGDSGDGYHMYPIQSSFGATVFKTDANGDFTSELNMGGDAGHAFAEYLAHLAQEGVTGPTINQDIVIDAFTSGQCPYIITGPWNAPALQEAGMDISVLPIPSAGGQPSQAFMSVPGFFLSAKAQNPVAATEFLLNYVTRTDVQISLFQAGGRTPASLAAQADPIVANDPVAQGFAAASATAVVQPSIPAMNSVWGPWGITEVNIANGTATDPAAAWDQMVIDITNAIASAG